VTQESTGWMFLALIWFNGLLLFSDLLRRSFGSMFCPSGLARGHF
jgi:hypothetical protein